MRNLFIRKGWHYALLLILLLAIPTLALADGTETLGMSSIPIASGTGIVAGGTGLQVQPNTISVEVPAGASVNQVLLYWSGGTVGNSAGDDTISVDGNAITGTLIGGPAFFYICGSDCPEPGEYWFSAYRADITGLGLVSAGMNTLTVDGMNFSLTENNGASVLVIYDDGSTAAEIDVRDGIDLAFFRFPEPRRSTIPQTFNFTPASSDRVATLSMFNGSAEDSRPNEIVIDVDGTVTSLVNALGSNAGEDWDTLNIPVNIPAGASSLTVQIFSTESRDPLGASLTWIGAGLSVPTEEPPGGEGCTPGYWKNHLDSWVGYNPTDDYEATFGVDASFSKNLLGALNQGGGGEKALGRHATAALLNASSSVSYFYTEAQVIQLVQDAYASGDFEGVKNLFEYQNELGCPLN